MDISPYGDSLIKDSNDTILTKYTERKFALTLQNEKIQYSLVQY